MPRRGGDGPHGGVGVVPGVEVLGRGQLVAGRAFQAWPAIQASMARAARLPCPMASVRVRAPATMSPPAKIPGRAVIMSAPTGTTPSATAISGMAPRSERSASCPSARTTESARSSSISPVGCGNPSLVELHPLDREDVALGADDGREPLEPYAFVDGVLHLLDVGGHALAGAAVDDDGVLGTEPARRAGGIHGGVAAAVDHDASAERRRLVILGVVQTA